MNSTTTPSARETLETMLRHLGFAVTVHEEPHGDAGMTLQVTCQETSQEGDEELLIGPEGETLEELQYLLNRVLLARDPDAPKVAVDVGRYRDQREDRFLEKIKQCAEMVRQTGQPFHLDPMNAYDRRLVHHLFKEDPEVTTWSPTDDARIKRITLLRRK